MGAWSSVNQNIARPIVDETSEEKSECTIPTGSQHANRTQSLDDLSRKGKENLAVLRDQDIARKDDLTSTQTQSFEELLELLREFHPQNVRGGFHSSPQYGTGSFARPYTDPTPDASRNLDGTLHLLPEYKIPPTYVTKVYHHHHYHYNAPNVSPPPVINQNIVRINNKNTSNGSDGSESGDDEGENQFLNGCSSSTLTRHAMAESTTDQEPGEG